MLSDLMATDLPEGSPTRDLARDVRLACQDALALCGRNLASSRSSCDAGQRTELTNLVTRMSPLLTTWMSPAAALRFELAPELPLLDMAPDAIGRIVMNLVKNAAEALSGRPGVVIVSTGWIELTTEDVSNGNGCGTLRPGRHVCLTVSDTGCGIDRAAQVRLRRESFTTKTNGHGLGLASVRRIAAAHQAGIQLESRVGAGTTVRVVFNTAPPIDDSLPHTNLQHTNERDWR
jgi:signal transduction histidine kinase